MRKLREHQQTALNQMAPGKILCGGVGSGKTLTSLSFWYRDICGGELNPFGPVKTFVPLYIITTARKRDTMDWEEELTHLLIEPSMGVVVDSWNNLHKYEDVKNAFFIFDEQRIVGSGAWVKSFYKVAERNRWILLSATPGDVWMDYIPVFVANGFYKNKSEFLERHVIYNRFSRYPKVDKYVGTKRLYALREALLVDMPFERHTTRHEIRIPVEFDMAMYKKVLKERVDPYSGEPIQNATGLAYALRRASNDAFFRIPECIKLYQKHPRLIIFYNFDYELEDLRTLADLCGVEVREYNGHKHEDVPTGDRWIYLVQYMSGSEAWNCTTTDAMVFYSLNYSHRMMSQAKGRTDRLDTPYEDLYYYTLMSGSNIDLAIWEAIRRKKTFSESAFAKRAGGF